jgi:hypothetical protein
MMRAAADAQNENDGWNQPLALTNPCQSQKPPSTKSDRSLRRSFENKVYSRLNNSGKHSFLARQEWFFVVNRYW